MNYNFTASPDSTLDTCTVKTLLLCIIITTTTKCVRYNINKETQLNAHARSGSELYSTSLSQLRQKLNTSLTDKQEERSVQSKGYNLRTWSKWPKPRRKPGYEAKTRGGIQRRFQFNVVENVNRNECQSKYKK
jgi:hypothetical protein